MDGFIKNSPYASLWNHRILKSFYEIRLKKLNNERPKALDKFNNHSMANYKEYNSFNKVKHTHDKVTRNSLNHHSQGINRIIESPVKSLVSQRPSRNKHKFVVLAKIHETKRDEVNI